MDGHQRQREESRRRIEAALFVLLEKKSFAQITVSELVKKADASRRTFYRLYSGKDEVLEQYFYTLCESYKERCRRLDSYEIGEIAEDYFGFWYLYRDRLLLLKHRGLEGRLFHAVSRLSEDVVTGRIGSSALQTQPGATYFALYSAGGFLHLLWYWIEQGMQGRPEDYAREVSSALQKFLAAQQRTN